MNVRYFFGISSFHFVCGIYECMNERSYVVKVTRCYNKWHGENGYQNLYLYVYVCMYKHFEI